MRVVDKNKKQKLVLQKLGLFRVPKRCIVDL